MRPLSSRRPITGLTRTRHVDNTFFSDIALDLKSFKKWILIILPNVKSQFFHISNFSRSNLRSNL